MAAGNADSAINECKGGIVALLKTKNYKEFPKADARRYFVALMAIDRLKDRATIHYVAQDIGCTRAEAQRALEAAETQFGVILKRDGSRYVIASWGVLNKLEIAQFIKSDD